MSEVSQRIDEHPMIVEKKNAYSKSNRSMASLAVLFATALLSAPSPALGASSTDKPDAVIQRISQQQDISPQGRAYYLLELAYRVTFGSYSPSDLQNMYGRTYVEPKLVLSKSERGANATGLSIWVKDISDQFNSETYQFSEKIKAEPGRLSFEERKALGLKATEDAVALLSEAPENPKKIALMYIAARMFQRVGEVGSAQKCLQYVEKVTKACEENQAPNEEEAEAIALVLNAMANDIIQVVIPLYSPADRNEWAQAQPHVKPFSAEEFEKAQNLKLRAVALLDRFPSDNQDRRMAHRNLVLWYTRLDKPSLADKAKLVFFELIGAEDDSLLYPQSAGCGHLVWWQVKKLTLRGACGMG